MLDPALIAHGALSNVAGESLLDMLEGEKPSTEDLLCLAVKYLRDIADATSLKDSPNIDEPCALQPYPYEYVTDDHNHNRPHVSIFFATSTPSRFDVPGAGTYLKTVGPGWVQCDLPGNTRISTTDSLTHNVIVSYRDNPIGATSL